MHLSLRENELKDYVGRQLQFNFPDKYSFKGNDVDIAFKYALERTEWCFKHITLNGYTNGKDANFSHLHSDQYSQFLYYLSNSLWKQSENKPICDKLIFLNKALNGIFYSYKAELPNIFLLGHPVGTIIGNANYSDFLVILQNVTINTDCDSNNNRAPKIGKGVFLGAGAKIIGNKPIGDRVSIGVNTMVYNKEIENDSIVYTNSMGNVEVIKRKKMCKAQSYFNVPIE
ncbi:hypothetical protein UT300007_02220 [Clostridium sp. CTA-7]